MQENTYLPSTYLWETGSSSAPKWWNYFKCSFISCHVFFWHHIWTPIQKSVYSHTHTHVPPLLRIQLHQNFTLLEDLLFCARSMTLKEFSKNWLSIILCGEVQKCYYGLLYHCVRGTPLSLTVVTNSPQQEIWWNWKGNCGAGRPCFSRMCPFAESSMDPFSYNGACVGWAEQAVMFYLINRRVPCVMRDHKKSWRSPSMASFSYILFQLKREHVQPWLFLQVPLCYLYGAALKCTYGWKLFSMCSWLK